MKTKTLLAAIAAFLLAQLASAQTPAATATAAPPADAAALHQQSLESAKEKKFKEAVDFADQATKADATKPEYYSQLGIALSQRMSEVNFMQMAALSGRMKKAFEKSLELDPNHVSGLIGLARFYANAPEIAGGSLERAAEYAARLQKLNPLLGELELGRIAEKGEQYAEALAHYDAALKTKADSLAALLGAGRTLARLGKKDDARARFEAALKINPEFEPAKKALAGLDAPPAGGN